MLKTFEKNGVLYMQLVENKGYEQLPADKRLCREKTTKINQKFELENIQYQERLMEVESQRKLDLKEIPRDSCKLYDDDKLIEG